MDEQRHQTMMNGGQHPDNGQVHHITPLPLYLKVGATPPSTTWDEQRCVTTATNIHHLP
ncbi:hypothetical protein K443DRAFT_14740 [Laccaria amethystina LaAM-08-1]|uniref:Uncharacterized protein n=1 Tax=Laccaria amethystina LaAM-08-1 TaxID=1095629 RepID=A0A0C9X0G6_9AGAR|nr:hypothetical protein K443DRAFT_14740 [Laccaria amethystina LaAM-08-1]